MARKWSTGDLQEARKVVQQFRLLSQLFVDEKGYLFIDKQSREVCEALEVWLASCGSRG